MRYDVVIVGYKLNASIKPAQALQSVLGLDLETARTMTRQFPAAVLTGLSLSRAESIAQQLTDCGAKVEVRESRLSHASEPSPEARPFPLEENTGGYAIGEILAPMSRHNSSAPGPAGAGKRPSREQLDAALRESLRPQVAGPPARPSLSPEHDAAFAGITNFESLDGYTEDAAALEVDEVAFQSIQRRPEAAAAKRKGPSWWQRLLDWAGNLASGASEWASGLLWLGLISALTLAAVGYALDPTDIVGALQLGTLSERARRLLGQ